MANYIKAVKWSLVHYHLTAFLNIFHNFGLWNDVDDESLVSFIFLDVWLNSEFTCLSGIYDC